MIIYKNKKLIVPNGLGLNTDGIIPSDEYATKEYVNTKVDGLADNVYTKEEVDELVKDFGAVVIENGKTYTEEDVEKIKKTKLVAILDTNLTYKISTVLGKDYLSGYWYGSTQIPIKVESLAWSLEKDGDVYKASVWNHTYNMDDRINRLIGTSFVTVKNNDVISKEVYDDITHYRMQIILDDNNRKGILVPSLLRENYWEINSIDKFNYAEKTDNNYQFSRKLVWFTKNDNDTYTVKVNTTSSTIYISSSKTSGGDVLYNANYINDTFYTKEESDTKYALKSEGGDIIRVKEGDIITDETLQKIVDAKMFLYTNSTDEYSYIMNVEDLWREEIRIPTQYASNNGYAIDVWPLGTNSLDDSNRTRYNTYEFELYLALFEVQEDGTYKVAEKAIEYAFPDIYTLDTALKQFAQNKINGQSFKTINNQSIIGTGNIEIDGCIKYHLDSMSQQELVTLYNLIKASTLAEIAKMDITFEDTDNDTLYRATSIKRHTDYIDFASNNEGQLIAVSLNSDGTLS